MNEKVVEPLTNVSGKDRPRRQKKVDRKRASELDKLLESVFEGTSK